MAAAEAAVTRALAVVPGRDARTVVGLAGSVTTVTALALAAGSASPDRIATATAIDAPDCVPPMHAHADAVYPVGPVSESA